MQIKFSNTVAPHTHTHTHMVFHNSTYEFARDSKTLFRLLKEEIPVCEPAAKNV